MCACVSEDYVRGTYLGFDVLDRAYNLMWVVFFFLMIRRPPRSTQSRSSAASDVYKRQELDRMQIQADREREEASRRDN